MADLLYGGTGSVGPHKTQDLLGGPFHAVWFPPFARRIALSDGDRLWVFWQGADRERPRLLGAGRVELAPDGSPAWTSRTASGIREAAKESGFGGPTNIAFVRLAGVRIDADVPEISGLGPIAAGFSAATERQARTLAIIPPCLTHADPR